MRVRSAEDVLATLDELGRLDGLPFMPEMLAFCGQEVPVFRSAHKVCDSITKTGNRKMVDTVHLQGLRCDGSAHGGCQSACLLHWKEAWLEPVEDGAPALGAPRAPAATAPPSVLVAATSTGRAGGEAVWSCQATRMLDASTPMRPSDLRQYVRDVSSGNARVLQVLAMLLRALVNRYQDVSARVVPAALRFRGGRRSDDLRGTLTTTPRTRLDLQPGELVEVKSREEIIATLDTRARNRGLEFEPGMLPYCGRRARVQARVSRIIDERTGRMRHLQNDCVVLEGFECSPGYHGLCPRAAYVYWREAWLRRVT